MNHTAQARPTLLDRFPALHRLHFDRPARRIPYIQQLTGTECGAACLAMVLGYHGRSVRLEEVRQVMGASRDGVTARGILNAADWYGLRGRGVKLDVEDLRYLDSGSILHWEFNHFVVFAGLRGGSVEIVDPASGRRRVPMEQFRKAFTGVALLLEPTDALTPQPLRGGHLWRHARQIVGYADRWSRLLFTSLILQVFGMAVPALTSTLVDRVVPRGDAHLLTVMSAGMLMLLVFHFLAGMIRSHLLLHLRTYLDARMTLGFCEHLVALPYAFFQQRSAGDLLMRLNSNATVREILTSGALSSLLDGALIVVYLIALLLLSPSMSALVLALGAVQVAVFMASRRRRQELMARNLETQARAESYQVEMLAGIETLKTAGSEQRAVEHWSGLFVDVLNVSLERGRLYALVDALASTLRLASPLFILSFGAFQVLRGDISLGTMMGLSALSQGFLVPLGGLVSTAAQFQLLGGYVERLDDVLDTPPEQDRAAVRPAEPLRGAISLERVNFRYGPLAPFALSDVSLSIPPGQFVAIVGGSGSGKSTLASLLSGLFRPTSGRIRYDGVDIAELDLRSLRRQLGMVTQHPYIFGGSVRANIALSDPGIPLATVVTAAELAHIHDDIEALPMGYETLLLDRGASLSGGQRQRLALARALLRRPAILILDEATSALDAVSERAVQASLEQLRCTRIVIAHRLSTVVNADLILVMDAGRMIEAGTHDELLSRGGAYARLVEAQLARPSHTEASTKEGR